MPADTFPAKESTEDWTIYSVAREAAKGIHPPGHGRTEIEGEEVNKQMSQGERKRQRNERGKERREEGKRGEEEGEEGGEDGRGVGAEERHAVQG